MKYKVNIYHFGRLRLAIVPREGWTHTGVQGCYLIPNSWIPLYSSRCGTAYITWSGKAKRRGKMLPGGHYRGRLFDDTVNVR